MRRFSHEIPLRLTLGSYFLYSGLRKFEPEAPGRMEPLITRGYPAAVKLVGFPRFFRAVRLFELLTALGLLLGWRTRLAGAASACFGGLLLVLLWRLPDIFHDGSRWRLTVKGMEQLKNLWIVGIGMALAIGPDECADATRSSRAVKG